MKRVEPDRASGAARFEESEQLWMDPRRVQLGPATVFNIDAHGNAPSGRLLSSPASEHTIVLTLPAHTTSPPGSERSAVAHEPRDMVLLVDAASHLYARPGDEASHAFGVEADQLGLPMGTVRHATRALRRSPLYELVRDHLAQVARDAPAIAETAVAAQVGLASVALIRALIVSAADDGARLHDVMHISMAARVQTYVHDHLRDADLSPAKVAAANGLSVRSLYSLYEALGLSLEQSIIEQRLEGARADLASRRHAHRSIAAIARDWCFSHPGYFSTRFRSRYGMTPREWRTAQSRTVRAR